MLILLLTTGSDKKPVWLLLETASSDSIKMKKIENCYAVFSPHTPRPIFPSFPVLNFGLCLFFHFTQRPQIVVSPLVLIRL